MGLFAFAVLSLVLTAVQGVDRPRGAGLLMNFEDLTLDGQQLDSIAVGNFNNLPSSARESWTPNGRLLFFGQQFGAVEVRGNGQVYFLPSVASNISPLTTGQVQQVNFRAPTSQKFVAALHVDPSVNLRVSRAHRFVNCAQTFTKADCTTVAGKVNVIERRNPFANDAFEALYLLVVTFRYEIRASASDNTIVQSKKAQIVIANVRPKNNNLATSIQTRIMFLYEPNTGIGLAMLAYLNSGSGNTANTLFIDANCDDDSPLLFSTRSNQDCATQGLYAFDTSAPRAGSPNPICTSNRTPIDSCTESVWCLRQGTTTTMSIGLLYVEPNILQGPKYYGYDLVTRRANTNCLLTRNSDDRLVVTYTQFTGNPCNILENNVLDINGNIIGTTLTLRLIRLDEEGFRQHNDYILTATCNINDLDPTSTSFTLGTLTTIDVTKTRTIAFSLLASSGSTPQTATSPCRLGEPLFFQLLFTPTAYKDDVDIHGMRPTSCEISNNENFFNDGRQVTGFNVNGVATAAVVNAETVTFLSNGCPNTALQDLAFYLNNQGGTVQDSGFRLVPSNTARGQPWRLQAGPMKCASFKNTQRVYFRCRLDYCGANLPTTEQACRRSCTQNKRKRRQTSGPGQNGTDQAVVTGSWTVLPAESESFGRNDESVEEQDNCVGTSVAIATIVGLVVALVLASGLSIAAFIKTMYARSGSTKSVSSFSS